MLAFIAPAFPSQIAHRPRWTCVADSAGQDSGDSLSSTDRQYIAKIRAKLLNSRRVSNAASNNNGVVEESDTDEQFIANLPDSLDEIEDIIFDRGPKNTNQVRLFGGWLDESLAGRKARDPHVVAQAEKGGQFDVDSTHKSTLTKEEAVFQANEAFAAAMDAFNKGKYRVAVALYEDAVGFVGLESRLGGQYELWHAQALDAAGEKKRAAKMLQQLRSHSDADVRKVSAELLFIMTAPKLELEPGTFLDIPALDDNARAGRLSPVLTSSYGPLRTALLEKKPEQYSLEWYMQKERPPKMVDNSAMELVLIAAAVGFTLAYMFSTSPS